MQVDRQALPLFINVNDNLAGENIELVCERFYFAFNYMLLLFFFVKYQFYLLVYSITSQWTDNFIVPGNRKKID